MCCENSRTVVYHNWLPYASAIVKCIITTLLTIINHSITYVCHIVWPLVQSFMWFPRENITGVRDVELGLF